MCCYLMSISRAKNLNCCTTDVPTTELTATGIFWSIGMRGLPVKSVNFAITFYFQTWSGLKISKFCLVFKLSFSLYPQIQLSKFATSTNDEFHTIGPQHFLVLETQNWTCCWASWHTRTILYLWFRASWLYINL